MVNATFFCGIESSTNCDISCIKRSIYSHSPSEQSFLILMNSASYGAVSFESNYKNIDQTKHAIRIETNPFSFHKTAQRTWRN
jgi:hypothetical protein